MTVCQIEIKVIKYSNFFYNSQKSKNKVLRIHVFLTFMQTF